jgi:hypothetical protein
MEFEEEHGWQTVRGKHRANRRFNQFSPDIATARNFSKDNISTTTTFFFTNFPERYGAKAVFNAFHNIGEVMEVVIPAKRDKGGRRFGFARFDQVSDLAKLESDLDNLVFGGVKISANLSRFQRSDGGAMESGRKGRSRSKLPQHSDRPHFRPRSKSIALNKRSLSFVSRDHKSFSYAQAVRKGDVSNRGSFKQKVFLSYEAEKNAIDKYAKAFVGVAANPGMTYNIQNAFHAQGYFGVKVTPLGSNLALLEGQEEGEVEALMEDAKDWLVQWFKEIRPWNPKDIDTERLVWLRIYGIPIHAWCDDFFAKVSRPWGCFLNTDHVTSKKFTMDAARLLIRTSCQKPVDEFIDVNINDEIFHLRVIEDSHGPMRIVISQPKGKDGRGFDSDCSDEEEEERRLVEEEPEPESERESEGEGENLLALNPVVKNFNEPLLSVEQDANSNFELEGSKANSFTPNNANSINTNNVVIEEFVNVSGGGSLEIREAVRKDRWVEVGCKDLGQEGGVVGPTLYTNLHQSVKGGGDRRKTKSDLVGCSTKPNLNLEGSSGSTGVLRRGVYSDGPRGVYNFLNQGQQNLSLEINQEASIQKRKPKASSCLPSASLRKQQHMARSLSQRNSNTSLAVRASSISSIPSVGGASKQSLPSASKPPSTEVIVSRGPVGRKFKATSNRAASISSAGEILCCSSLSSSDIRNCNKKILQKFEQEVISKVWKGAVELGVEIDPCGSTEGLDSGALGALEEVCLKEIQDNERRDEAESLRREQRNNVPL